MSCVQYLTRLEQIILWQSPQLPIHGPLLVHCTLAARPHQDWSPDQKQEPCFPQSWPWYAWLSRWFVHAQLALAQEQIGHMRPSSWPLNV